MTRKIRDCIIGCGSMGREHIENVKLLDRTEVSAIADSDSRAAAAARLPGQARVFESYPELLAAEGLRSVATAIAVHRSSETSRVVTMAEVLPAGW